MENVNTLARRWLALRPEKFLSSLPFTNPLRSSLQ